MKKYIIEEEDLLRLLSRSLELDCLEVAGVDNWSWYMCNRDDFLAEEMCIEVDDVRDLDIDFNDAARDWLKRSKNWLREYEEIEKVN